MGRSKTPDWRTIRRDYEAGKLLLREIAALHGLSTSSISRRAKSGGWSRRAGKSVRGAGRSGGSERQLRPARTNVGRRALIKRFYREMERRLAMFEEPVCGDTTMSAGDREREVRALGVLLSNFEKLAAYDDKLGDDRQAAAAGRSQDNALMETATDGDVADDAERWRAEIAERIERLRAHGETEGNT